MFIHSLAFFEKTFKEFIRDRATLFWTIAWPSVWLLLMSTVFTRGIAEDILPQVTGMMTISMVGLALMTSGMVNLAGSIAGDRQRGVYQKITSMPVKAWEDAVGRLGGLLAFALVSSLLVLVVGLALGARFSGSVVELLQCIGCALLVLLASNGVGMIIGSIATSEGSATHIGVGVTVITGFIGGVFMSYSALPEFLQLFSQLYPPSSAISSITYILEGEIYAGYNPLAAGNMIYTVVCSLAIFVLGLIIYGQRLWSNRF